jgi:hypothetical protein
MALVASCQIGASSALGTADRAWRVFAISGRRAPGVEPAVALLMRRRPLTDAVSLLTSPEDTPNLSVFMITEHLSRSEIGRTAEWVDPTANPVALSV